MRNSLLALATLGMVSCNNQEEKIQQLQIQIDSIKAVNKVRDSSQIVGVNTLKTYTPEEKSIDELIMEDLSNLPAHLILDKWEKYYELLPEKYKLNVMTKSGESYPMDYGDAYGLNKGFSWGV